MNFLAPRLIAPPLITFVLSFAGTRLGQYLADGTRFRFWLGYSEEICRAGLLSYALLELLPDAVADLGIITSLAVISIVCLLFRGMDYTYRRTCSTIGSQQNSWYQYIFLLPHCFIEGLAAAPIFYRAEGVSPYIVYFLWHKVSELLLLAVSISWHIPSTRDQQRLLALLVSATPLAMLLGSTFQQAHTLVGILENWHGVYHAINAAVFIHISLFCTFCQCNPGSCKSTSSTRRRQLFLLSLVILALAKTYSSYALPLDVPCPHHQSKHRSTTKPCTHAHHD